MKSTIIALLGAAVTVVADSHVHNHQHLHARVANSPDPVVQTVTGPTVIVFELNGKFISQAEVEQGIKNGTLIYAPNGAVVPSGSIPSSTAAPAAPSKAPAVNNAVAPSPPAPSPAPASSSPSNHNSGSSSGGHGADDDFPDNTLSCSTFPSQYGAVPVDWEGLGGWTGVQKPGSTSGGFGNILTVTKDLCSGGDCCSEGAFCSYACPAGYSKAQWPDTQGATGQSVGGIQCQGGKLRLTSSSSKKLCQKGTDQVTVEIINNLGKNVAVCRTDYPGTESMTVPLDVQPGSSLPLTCPDATNSYHWQGGSTSAQYYVNPAGVSASEGCTWGQSGQPKGNYAPLNLGVGYSNGAAWLSVFQNKPTTTAKLEFTVEIKGDHIIGSCKYSNGQYCGDTGCSADGGCTVSAASGKIQYIFS